mmetsp:Transcript_16383/g.39599  ORF Transcript_16383/g.39599 Transcript_16383/m.39599 type:complete len:258 (+) Transcript_16383:574-1347(+)
MLIAKLVRGQRRRPLRNRKHKRRRRRLQKRQLPQCHNFAVLVLNVDRLDEVGNLLLSVHRVNQTIRHTRQSALTHHNSRSRPIHEQKRSMLVVHLQRPVYRLRRPEQLTLTTNVLRHQRRTSPGPILNHQTSRSIPSWNALSHRAPNSRTLHCHWYSLMPTVQVAVQVRRDNRSIRWTLEGHHCRRCVSRTQTLHPQHRTILIHSVHHLDVMNALWSTVHHGMHSTDAPVRRSSLPDNNCHQILSNGHVRSVLGARK